MNSFGFGGANAHAILDDPYNYLRLHALHGKHSTLEVPPSSQSLTRKTGNSPESFDDIAATVTENHRAEPKPRLFVWSAAEESGLKRLAKAYGNYLQNRSSHADQNAFLANLAYTLAEKRSHLQWKSLVVASSIDDLRQTLARGFLTTTSSARTPNLSFIFTGQGAQWYAMGRELLDYPVFRRSLKDAEVFFKNLGCAWTLIGMLCYNNYRILS